MLTHTLNTITRQLQHTQCKINKYHSNLKLRGLWNLSELQIRCALFREFAKIVTLRSSLRNLSVDVEHINHLNVTNYRNKCFQCKLITQEIKCSEKLHYSKKSDFKAHRARRTWQTLQNINTNNINVNCDQLVINAHGF